MKKIKVKKIIIYIMILLICTLLIFWGSTYIKKQKIIKELESLENGYGDFPLLGERKNFKDLELIYVGEAKVNPENYDNSYEFSTERPYFDGTTLFAFWGYIIFGDERIFNIYKGEEWFNLSDINFEMEEDKTYLMSIGRKLKKLQYNPDWITQFGTVVNRAVFDWNEEFDPSVVYIYEYEYDYKKYGGLANMTIEF